MAVYAPYSIWTTLLLLIVSFCSCNNQESAANNPLKLVGLPPESVIQEAKLETVNCWIENDYFYIVGTATNLYPGPGFRRIWLLLEVMDSTGQVVPLNGETTVAMPLFSEAVPPRGLSSFMAGWPLKSFAGIPDSIRLIGARGIDVSEGPILVTADLKAVKMITHDDPSHPEGVEKNWQVSAEIANPLARNGRAIAVELLLYGTDNRLYFSQWLSVLDPNRVLQEERTGPLQPGEKRRVGLLVPYEGLPKRLQQLRIGRAEILASEDRE